MATLDGYVPYATGMTAKMAVEALWRAYKLPEHSREVLENSAMVFESDQPPSYTYIKDLNVVKFPIWHNMENNRYYYGDISDSVRKIFWFQFF